MQYNNEIYVNKLTNKINKLKCVNENQNYETEKLKEKCT